MNKNLLLGGFFLLYGCPAWAQSTYWFAPLESICQSMVQYVYQQAENDTLLQKNLTEQVGLQQMEEHIYLVFDKQDSILVYSNVILHNESISVVDHASLDKRNRFSSPHCKNRLRHFQQLMDGNGVLPLQCMDHFTYTLVGYAQESEKTLWYSQFVCDSLAKEFRSTAAKL